MAEFLDAFDVERDGLFEALSHFETVWSRFRERQRIEVEGSDLSDSLISSELALVRAELQRANFTIGVFGLIKRGKSTLLNSLIGREVSSMHVTPETAVPVYVSYNDTPGATVHFADGSQRHVAVEDVSQFSSQKHNLGNHLGVTHVEQGVPVPFLRNGTRLIDTPGLDDAAADDVYTERTLQELDVCDAGIVVFLSPPTVGATEMDFIEELVGRDLTKTFLVCNMYPQHFNDKQTRRDVLNYIGKRIVEASRRAGQYGEVRVYPVCAYEAWQARVHDDVDTWKKSGADRLLRDLESFLGDVAGRSLLEGAVERIEKAAQLARGEVQIRLQLLSDPDRLEELRGEVDGRVRQLESEVRDTMHQGLAAVDPLRLKVRGTMLAPFRDAANDIDDLDDAEAVEAYAATFRRRVEVAAEDAAREFGQGFHAIVDEMRGVLEQRLEAVVQDVVPNLPKLQLTTSTLLVTHDQLQSLRSGSKRATQTERASALAGGVAGGGAVALAAGAVLLAPIGLLAGALAGWKLSSVIVGDRRLSAAKDTMRERMDDIAGRLTRDFDEQVRVAVESVEHAVDVRRKQFAADLYDQFDLVSRVSHDPNVLAQHRTEAERFGQAFEACAVRARRVLETTVFA